MNKSLRITIASLTLVSLLAAGAYLRQARAQGAEQFPVLDMVAGKVIQKYQQSTCEQLWEKKSEKTPPGPEEQRVLEILKNNPEMRAAFINKVAAPIANKMFECGMIP